MSSLRTFQASTVEYLEALVKSTADLVGDPVQLSFDEQTWFDATWTTAPANALTPEDLRKGLTHAQVAQALVGEANPLPAAGLSTVYVRITDNPEAPVIVAGKVRIQ